MTKRYQDVLDFWFGSGAADIDAQAMLWWGKDPATDALIREQFAATRRRAVQGLLHKWEAQPASRLALIILVDQFSRNLFRDDARAFADDALVRGWCMDGLHLGHDRQLDPVQRVFFYLPLEHSESLDDQQRAVLLFDALVGEVDVDQRARFESFADYARRHHAVIERFGRFPHRNAALHRESTPAELEFLQQPGSSF